MTCLRNRFFFQRNADRNALQLEVVSGLLSYVVRLHDVIHPGQHAVEVWRLCTLTCASIWHARAAVYEPHAFVVDAAGRHDVIAIHSEQLRSVRLRGFHTSWYSTGRPACFGEHSSVNYRQGRLPFHFLLD